MHTDAPTRHTISQDHGAKMAQTAQTPSIQQTISWFWILHKDLDHSEGKFHGVNPMVNPSH